MLGWCLTKMIFEMSALLHQLQDHPWGALRRLWGAQIKGDLRAAGW